MKRPGLLQRLRAAIKPSASYDAAKETRYRKLVRKNLPPNRMVEQASLPLRMQVRNLERNHDLTRGALRTLVNNVVGPNGIGIEPQPRRKDGTIHEEYANALREAFRDWCRRPEVTQSFSWARCQRMMVRSWWRDGECFAQGLIGKVPGLDHGTRVPFSLELFEADMVPLNLNDNSKRIRQGIEVNEWGRKRALYVYKLSPLADNFGLPNIADVKRISFDNVLHIYTPDRLHQLRGVSELASVITRLDDLKDYEESERIAAKLAARLAMYVKRGTPDLYDPDAIARDEQGNPVPREIEIEAGTIFDGLGVGEEIGLIDTKRPNPNALTWRQGQLRAAASGVGISNSSFSKSYDGTYSAQRQELVEQWINYAVLTDDFCGMAVVPVWEWFVQIADMSGVVPRPADVVPESADDCLLVAQAMPWIDPLKEANAWNQLVRSGFASEVEAIRRRGGSPHDVMEQIAAFRKKAKEKGLVFESDAATDIAAKAPDYTDPNAPIPGDTSV